MRSVLIERLLGVLHLNVRENLGERLNFAERAHNERQQLHLTAERVGAVKVFLC